MIYNDQNKPIFRILMKPLRLKLQEACTLKKSRLDIVEKDYALSYLLAGIAKQKKLTDIGYD
ncbi:MAG TPA: hypothetical protein VJN02_04490 [Gammaproteobacteria bacterium]|nr:hypothetical protein [Gammaproteobacteria bacterium]